MGGTQAPGSRACCAPTGRRGRTIAPLRSASGPIDGDRRCHEPAPSRRRPVASAKTSSRLGESTSTWPTAMPASSALGSRKQTAGTAPRPMAIRPARAGRSPPNVARTPVPPPDEPDRRPQGASRIADSLLECGGVTFSDDRATVDDRDTTGELVGFLQVLGGEKDRGAFVVERPDLLPHGLATWGRVRSSAHRGTTPMACGSTRRDRDVDAYLRSRCRPAGRRLR